MAIMSLLFAFYYLLFGSLSRLNFGVPHRRADEKLSHGRLSDLQATGIRVRATKSDFDFQQARVIQSSVPKIARVSYQYHKYGRLQTVSQTVNNLTRRV